ncbi:transglycosylase SLT domain-containing protein [Sedimentibacter sp. zth1]|uniref:transglycosylase SLT domain-containing protein n=1 Tax=Sedimentibacter sp. zth1 TaxID=2816908 RepID=UPI001A92F5D3|nr:transglycosylase SLT domain-containing protein [Sedimentibacter sp. zth1]QSX06995.1 transglycosylase SLT domain-containing protein [Sedimentibacter sp. zth1]
MAIESKNPTNKECIKYITDKSNQLGIPARLSLATAWIESGFTQFDYLGNTLRNPTSNDFGIMQITIGAKMCMSDWGYISNKDWDRLLIDWKFNIDIGLSELKSCYELSCNSTEEIQIGCKHFNGITTEDCIARATYSAYNAGPNNISRYRTPFIVLTSKTEKPYIYENRYDYRDINFWTIYSCKSWEKIVI